MQKHYLITGKVQGVGYRYFALEIARELGITGWVKNLPNGKVECLADGASDLLSDFEKSLWEGPANSYVSEVQTSTPKETSHFSNFQIRSATNEVD